MAVLGGITSIAQRRIRAKIFYNIFGSAKPAVKDASMTLTRHPVAAPRLGFVEEKIGISDNRLGSPGAVPGSAENPVPRVNDCRCRKMTIHSGAREDVSI